MAKVLTAPLLDLALLGESSAAGFFDRTDHAPAARLRPPHDDICKALVLHRIGDPQSAQSAQCIADPTADGCQGAEGADVDSVIRFFTENPEGVATVTLDGDYDSKRAQIEAWRQSGVPDSVRARAFVPYTFLINPAGEIHQMLPLGASGAHARGFNQSGYGIAFLGDFRVEPPSAAQLEAGVATAVALIRQLRLPIDHLKLLGHDDARAAIGQGPKQCPGAEFPLSDLCQRIRRSAQS
jgi:hypothetical protein